LSINTFSKLQFIVFIHTCTHSNTHTHHNTLINLISLSMFFSAALPVWFSMLHPLADISPVICRSGSELNYVSTSSKHIVYVSSELSPYISIIYDMNSKSHSLFLIRRTTPQVIIFLLLAVQFQTPVIKIMNKNSHIYIFHILYQSYILNGIFFAPSFVHCSTLYCVQ